MNNLVARPHSSVDKIPQIVAVARKSASSRLMHPLEKRRQQLMQAFKMVSENEQLLSAAMSADLKRNSAENHFVELYPVQANIVQALNNLDDWNHVEPVTPSIVFMMDKCETRRVPLGCVLIIGTWNYALTLILDPLVAALAGGNTAVVKLSEVSTNMTNVLAHLIEKYMDPKVVQIVTGAVPETTVLLNQKFDLIFYTGSTTVGRIIMQQAAKTLTPVLLELGGKSPVIVDEDCDFEATASRILWGKIVNCGQTCIAPDYVLVHKKAEKQLLAAFKSQFTKIVDGDFDTSDQYGRIISQGHFDRLKGLLDSQLKVAGTKTLIGGKTDRSSLFFEPTVLTGVGLDAETNPVMAGELFGPILPVIVVASIDEAIRPPPLSYYPHSKSREVLETVYTSIKGGNAVGNDVILNFGVHDLPFGGVGDSGLGNYHGKFGFDSMTRPLAVMTVRTPEIIASLRYPVNCYNPKSTVHKIVRWLTKPSAPTLFSRAARKSIKLLQAWSGGLFMLLIGLLIGSQIPK